MAEDRNHKTLELGDEVTVVFRVAEIPDDQTVILETVHNKEKKPEAGAVEEERGPAILTTPTFRAILQRKAPKPSAPTPTPASG